MKRKKTWVALLIVVLLLVLGAGGYLVWKLFLSGGSSQEGSAYVQSVGEILGIGSAGLNNRYSGVVEAKDVIKINPDSSLTIAECYVAAGDKVSVGTPLFGYDVDSLTLSYEQLQLDIVGIENSIKTGNDEIASLEKQITKAKDTKLYELKLQLQTVQLAVKKSEYELKDKQQKAADMKAAIEDSVVKSEVEGTVRSVRSSGSDASSLGYSDSSSSDAYITIVSGNDYCIKGTVSEQTIHSLYEGMPMLIRSRVNSQQTWSGVIYKVNTEQAEGNNNNNYYYSDGSKEQSSKYAFYVSVDSIEGLLMGQHVYIELDEGQTEEKTGLYLPSYYLIDEGGQKYVYAANKSNRIEKRLVTVGVYDENTDTYEILSGLTAEDKIAFPDESVQVGMLCTETAYVPEGTGSDTGNTGDTGGGDYNYGGDMTVPGGDSMSGSSTGIIGG